MLEKSFDDLKNQLDMKRFMQFIAIIYMSALRKKMETLNKINYSGKYGHIITKTQREILTSLKIDTAK